MKTTKRSKSPMGKYDIFISYRRGETADKAEHLFTLLEHDRFKGRVSFDRENLDGQFDIEILKRLDNCKDFIVILAQDTLSNLNKDDVEWYKKLSKCTIEKFPEIEKEMKEEGRNLDFVRLEIARALAKKKHIIPVVPNVSEYNFNNLGLPEDISLLEKQQAEKYLDSSDFLFKDIAPKIIKRLTSRQRRYVWAKLSLTLLLSVILIGSVVGWIKLGQEKDIFQNCRTKSEFEKFAQETYFFRSECADSLSCFESLLQNKTPINDASNTGRNDSIRVDWSDDCSLKQLRTLKKMINNMMFVEKGTFIMGSENPIGFENSERMATIEDDYYIGKFEVTELEWNIVMSDSAIGSNKMPIVNVSWRDCDEFARKLTYLSGLFFSIPSEKQWEYAAKKNGDADWSYAGSNNAADVANFKESSKNGNIEEIDSRKPNGLELYHMSGNVTEWCKDGNEKRKRIRGGSFRSSLDGIKVSYSDVASVDNRSNTIGLRLVINQ